MAQVVVEDERADPQPLGRGRDDAIAGTGDSWSIR
jgi:hypothetical protein